MILKKLQLEYVPFETYAPLQDKESLEAQAQNDKLQLMESWLLPQILAHYGRWKVALAEGQIDVQQTLKQNIGDSLWELGLWRVVARLARGYLVKSQSKPVSAIYSRLTPLILAGVKQYQGIDYKLWPKDQIKFVVEPMLCDAMCAEYDDFTTDELLEARQLGLTTKTGATAGILKSAISTWKLTGLQQLRVGELPILAQTMLCQIWAAHPSIRSEYMVLDPKNWDVMPKPLIDSEVITVIKKESTNKSYIHKEAAIDNRLPWEM